MNYLEYFKDGGQPFPIPDTIRGNNYIMNRKPGQIINYDFFSKNNLKYVGNKLNKANNALDGKMASINDIISNFAESLDLALGVQRNPNSQYLDPHLDVNRLTYNKLRP